MTLSDARKILGLGPDEDPRPHLEEFRMARERIAAMVREAPNQTLADRYQEGLVEFDQALAAVNEYLEALGLIRREEIVVPAEPPDAPPPPREEAQAGVSLPAGGRKLAWLLWLVVFLTGAAGGGWLYYKNEESQRLLKQARVTFLEREGAIFVENRRWSDAAKSFAEIETLMPGSEIALLGRRSIEAGMSEEQTQFVGYWIGQAIAELDAGRLDEAEAAARKVLERFPIEKEPTVILDRIGQARASQSRDTALAAARGFLEKREWQAALSSARGILAKAPDDAEARAIAADATAALEKLAADQARALDLFARAAERDHGQFDQQALDWLREAATLAPENPEIAARLEKMASYTRTLRVPGDFATPAEALAAARDNDRIVIAGQEWKGPLVIDAAVELQGAGPRKTIVGCPAGDGSAITIGPGAKGARVTGITFRHEAFHAEGGERFSAALVRGGGVTFTDCHFTGASGHGLAVIESGEAIALRCHFDENGWNGAAAIGKGAFLEARESRFSNNFVNGIESWDGAALAAHGNRCEGNSRNGIHADNGASSAVIEGNQLIANREFGLVLGSAASGKASGNTARANLLGGMAIRSAASAVPVHANQITLNQGPGLALDIGLAPESYADNTVEKNTPKDLLSGVDLSRKETAPETPAAEIRQ